MLRVRETRKKWSQASMVNLLECMLSGLCACAFVRRQALTLRAGHVLAIFCVFMSRKRCTCMHQQVSRAEYVCRGWYPDEMSPCLMPTFEVLAGDMCTGTSAGIQGLEASRGRHVHACVGMHQELKASRGRHVHVCVGMHQRLEASRGRHVHVCVGRHQEVKASRGRDVHVCVGMHQGLDMYAQAYAGAMAHACSRILLSIRFSFGNEDSECEISLWI